MSRLYCQYVMNADYAKSSTYGHSQLKTGHPVRSAIHKQLNGRLVLRWVTTWESLLLYVLHHFFVVAFAPGFCFVYRSKATLVQGIIVVAIRERESGE
jgi:hypothetical protein